MPPFALPALVLLGGRAAVAAAGEPCLCIFDIDRTLTAAQHSAGGTCPGAKVVRGVEDSAFEGGDLTLSPLAAQGLGRTFCRGCYLGVSSHGRAGGAGSGERAYLEQHVLVTPPHRELVSREPTAKQWCDSSRVTSPFVVHTPPGRKQDVVRDIVGWYAGHDIAISPWRVHFFGDHMDNVVGFRRSPFNARGVSCGMRDWSTNGEVGWCGATAREIVRSPGVATCRNVQLQPALPWVAPAKEPCLCVFDIDRTLTAAQGSASGACPNTETVYGITDKAYNGGMFTLSALAARGLSHTFCGACYLGVCSKGGVGRKFSMERYHLEQRVLATSPHQSLAKRLPQAQMWSDSRRVTSPFVAQLRGHSMPETVGEIVGWYANHNIKIPDQRVHFFSDGTANINAFRGSLFNAREVSCSSRDRNFNGRVGYCGATPQEIVKAPGVATCEEMKAVKVPAAPAPALAPVFP